MHFRIKSFNAYVRAENLNTINIATCGGFTKKNNMPTNGYPYSGFADPGWYLLEFCKLRLTTGVAGGTVFLALNNWRYRFKIMLVQAPINTR